MPRNMSHLICAACAGELDEEGNGEAGSCCWCGNDTTTGIWVRQDPEKMSCHHCEFVREVPLGAIAHKCDALAPVKIQEVWICTKHIQWAMDLAFKPVKDAMKACETDADA